MATVIDVTPGQLAGKLRGTGAMVMGAMRRGIVRAAYRGKAHLIAETDRKKVVYRGQYKGSFRVRVGGAKSSVVAELDNDSPIAGIIEGGARPHAVNAEGWAAIYEWVMRHGKGLTGKSLRRPRKAPMGPARPFHGDNAEAEAITNAIVRKIARDGQAPRWIFKDALDELTRILKEEVEHALHNATNQRFGPSMPDREGPVQE